MARIRQAAPQDEAVLSALIAASYARLDDGSYERDRLVEALLQITAGFSTR